MAKAKPKTKAAVKRRSSTAKKANPAASPSAGAKAKAGAAEPTEPMSEGAAARAAEAKAAALLEKKRRIARENGKKGGRPRKNSDEDIERINAAYAEAFADLPPPPERGDPLGRADWMGEVAERLVLMSIRGTADTERHGQIRADLGVGMRSLPTERLAAAERSIAAARAPRKPVIQAGAKAVSVKTGAARPSRRTPIRG